MKKFYTFASISVNSQDRFDPLELTYVSYRFKSISPITVPWFHKLDSSGCNMSFLELEGSYCTVVVQANRVSSFIILESNQKASSGPNGWFSFG